MPISAPLKVVEISFSRKVGTPPASAACSSSRIAVKPRPSVERSIVRAIADRDPGQRQHQRVEVLDIAAVERRLLRPDDVDAARAADIIPVDDQGLHDDRQRQGRDREEHAAAGARSDSPCRSRRSPT